MIKNFKPVPYRGLTPLPDYATGPSYYTLIGNTSAGYAITLARLTVSRSRSAGKLLAHALFESFDDHGHIMAAARTKMGGTDMEFVAVKNAMNLAGVTFNPSLPCTCDVILQSLGEWFMAQNGEITSVEVVSQTCH